MRPERLKTGAQLPSTGNQNLGRAEFFALPPSPLQQLNLVPLQYCVQIVRIDQRN
jgi:hypothetical protein